MIFWIAVFTGLLQLFLEHCMLYVIPLHMEFRESGESAAPAAPRAQQ